MHAHNAVTLLHVPPYLTKHGIHTLEVLTRVGVAPSALLDPDGWIPRELCFRLGEELVRVTGDRFAGAHVTDSVRLEGLRTWGKTVAAAPTLNHACRFAAGRLNIVHQGTELLLLTSRRQSQLRFRFIGALHADPLQTILGSLGVLRKIALLVDVPDAVSVRLSMPYSRGVDQLEQVFGPALEFGCDHDAIVIDREIMNSPIVRANPAVILDEGFETALEAGRLLTELLPFERPTIENVAARQHVAVRTLQRRLKDWGFTFEELLDDLRRSKAIELISSGKHTITESALLVGYSDTAHFTRAFKRWTGRSPREYREFIRRAGALALASG